ncbi:TlpA family protein disulfide reductase [Bradyrhizobium sp. 2TAF24]|uniref:TlpA family protein disulfide reductase n=1 Tax=Bradyrhizobium sp. 2TAF24 TaxID=3233011 RepID=UPI003F92C469
MTIERPTPLTAGPLSRRWLLGGALAMLAAARTASAAAGAPFGNVRHQFTWLRPVRPVPPLPLRRLDGVVGSLGALRGNIAVVNFWATWCPACRAELPALEQLQREMAGAGVEVVAVAVDRDPAVVAPFLRRLGIRRLPVYTDPNGAIWTKDGASEAPFILYGMPISYLVAPDGGITGYLAGEADWSSAAARGLIAGLAAPAAGDRPR